MARIVDYFKQVIQNKSKKAIITDPMLIRKLQEYRVLNKYNGNYDLNNKEFCKDLSEIEDLQIGSLGFSKEISNTFVEQLKMLLQEMNSLKKIYIYSGIRSDIDISTIFENMNEHIEEISIEGFDILTGISEETAKKFKDIKSFKVERSNMPNIPVFPNEECSFSFNGLDKTTVEYISYGINNASGNLHCDDSIANQIIYEIQRSAQRRELFREPSISISLDSYEKCPDAISYCEGILVNDISELSLEKLEMLKKDERIKNIIIRKDQTNAYDSYSLDECTAIREEIDKIIARVELPKDDDPDREKKIFAQVYKLLGERISYDRYAISDEGEKDDELALKCRNLKNGLLGVERDGEKKYLSVCAGYADILRNVLACFGIESEYVGSFSHALFEEKDGIMVPKVDENGKQLYKNGTIDPKGHAYNLVILDGQKYYCDLTWDAPNIKADRYPLGNFLVSYKKFLISHEVVGFYEERADKEANISVSYEEQCELLGQEINAKDKVEEMLQENYLSGFVSWYLDYLQHPQKTLEKNDFLRVIYNINSTEDMIFASSAKDKNVMREIGGNEYVFNTTNTEERENLQKQIKERWRGKSGHDSR